MYEFKTNVDINEYNNFIKNFEFANFMQEKAWANVKNNWDNTLCAVYHDNEIVAACSILIRKIAIGFKMFYIPRGYLIDFTSRSLLDFMTKEIKKLAKKHRAYVVKIDPNFCVSEKLFKNEDISFHIYSNDFEEKHNNLLRLKYIHTGYTKDIHKNLQPRYHMAIPLINENNEFLSYEQLLKTFKSKFRYYLGEYHAKRGVFFEEHYDKESVKEFVRLLKYTEKNKNIHLRNEDYFNRIIDNFKNRACILFGKVDLELYLKFLKETNAKVDEIKQVEELINEKGNIITLSTALLLLPNNDKIRCSEYLYAGNDLSLNKLNVSGGIALEAARISIKNNCHYCNLGGISGNLDDSLTKFKSKYNGVVLEFAGEYDLVIKKAKYKFIKTFKPILKKLYKLIKK